MLLNRASAVHPQDSTSFVTVGLGTPGIRASPGVVPLAGLKRGVAFGRHWVHHLRPCGSYGRNRNRLCAFADGAWPSCPPGHTTIHYAPGGMSALGCRLCGTGLGDRKKSFSRRMLARQKKSFSHLCQQISPAGDSSWDCNARQTGMIRHMQMQRAKRPWV